jgi:hypothetical protein
MKRLILPIIILCSAALFFFLVWEKQPEQTPDTVVVPTSTPTSTPERVLRFGSHEYTYDYFLVENHDQIHLIPNFESPESAESLITKNACTSAVNSGFYDKKNQPIGLWKNETSTLGGKQTNALLNGYYSISKNRPEINYDTPTNPNIAFQTGPMLITDGNIVKLAIQNDEPARRMAAGIVKNGSSIFIAVYDPLSPLRGPYLTDLPAIIELIAKQIHIELTASINLDGGSASTFYSDGKGVWELNPIGSLLCIK